MLGFLYRLWDALFQSLGLGQKEGNLLLLGLDNAGKTTLLHRLRTGSLPQSFPPTDRPSRNEFQHDRIKFQAWDLGGHEVVRHLWTDYLMDVTSEERQRKLAVLFLLDAADGNRLEEAGFELDNLLIHNIKQEKEQDENTMGNGSNSRRNVHALSSEAEDATSSSSSFPPVAILLNKCDLEDQALSTDEICQRIDYQHLVQQYSSERIAMFRISVLRGEGYQEAFQWISTFL